MSMVKFAGASPIMAGLAAMSDGWGPMPTLEPVDAANTRAHLFELEAARLEAAAADYRRMAKQMRASGRPDAAGV